MTNSLHTFYHVRFLLFKMRSSVVFKSKFQAMNFCDLMHDAYLDDFEMLGFFIQEY